VNGLVGVALTNAMSATVLALVVAAASRFVRRPGVLHALWLLVLFDLLTPPVVVVGILPTFDAPPAQAPREASRTWIVEPGPPAAVPPAPATSVAPASAATRVPPLGPAWLVGTAAVLLLALARASRFERLLARGSPAPGRIQSRAAALSRTLGLRRCPRVRLVASRVSPMLWFRPGRMEIVFPARLLPRLTPAELDALLGHELAHVRRGDHWVRWVELAASALFFWHPVVWWARAALRRAEESSCDAWVTRILPAHARDYAAGLIKTLEFLTPSRRPVPALASGLGHFRRLEERLTMILKHRTPPFTTRAQRAVLAVAGLAFLLVFPGAAERSASADGDSGAGEESAAIEAELRQLEQRQMELSMRLHELYRVDEQERLRDEVARLEAEGRHDEAQRLETEAARMGRRVELEREHEDLARARAKEAIALEDEMTQVRQELERAAASGRDQDVERAQRELAQLEEEMAARAIVIERRAIELETQAQAVELEAQVEQARRLAREGQPEDAARIERELAQRRAEIELLEAQRRGELERFVLEREAARLERQAEELAGRGDEQQALEMRRRALELDRARQGLERRGTAQAIRAELVRIRAELVRLVELDREAGLHDAEIDELRLAVDELERELERLRGEPPSTGEIH